MTFEPSPVCNAGTNMTGFRVNSDSFMGSKPSEYNLSTISNEYENMNGKVTYDNPGFEQDESKVNGAVKTDGMTEEEIAKKKKDDEMKGRQ